MKVIFLGSGNLATRLSLEMHRKGIRIGQVYSHTPENAQQLAALLGCPWTTDPEAVETDADLYVFSLKDTVLVDVIARVFACNFTNHIYALAVKLLQEQDIPANVLLPLIDETAAKIHTMPPKVAQTGPAIRYDENVINKHLAMLGDSDMRSIYQLISQSIHKEAQHE